MGGEKLLISTAPHSGLGYISVVRGSTGDISEFSSESKPRF